MKSPSYNVEAKREFAAQMRRRPTLAEHALWYRLKKKQTGFVFHRQSLQRGYILDFYCPRLRLAIEVDGSIHDLAAQRKADEEKERALTDAGIKVLRFTNQDVLDFVSVVMIRIATTLKALAPCSVVNGATKPDSRISRACASVDKPSPAAPADKTSVDESRPVPASASDYAALIAAAGKLERLDRQRSFAFDSRSSAERAFEQKYRLQEWLKKHPRPQPVTEAAALTLQGMYVTEPIQRKA